MTIDELIAALSVVRADHGNLLVLVHDGSDPSDLCPVKLIETGVVSGPGIQPDYEFSVRLLTG